MYPLSQNEFSITFVIQQLRPRPFDLDRFSMDHPRTIRDGPYGQKIHFARDDSSLVGANRTPQHTTSITSLVIRGPSDTWEANVSCAIPLFL